MAVPPTLRLPTNAPGSPGFDKALGKWQHIGTRARDPQALTIADHWGGPANFRRDVATFDQAASMVPIGASVAVTSDGSLDCGSKPTTLQPNILPNRPKPVITSSQIK